MELSEDVWLNVVNSWLTWSLKLQPALEELAVQNVGCSVNACKSLAELVQHAQSLRTLRLYNNMSDDDGAKSIAKVLLLSEALKSKSTWSTDEM